MKQKNRQKKKKRSRAGKTTGDGEPGRNNKEKKEEEKEKDEENPETIAIRFGSFSLEEATSVFKEANGDPNKAAEILSCSMDGSEVPSTSSVSSGFSSVETGSSSGTGSSDGYVETACVQNMLKEKGFRGSKQKRVVATTGTVSTMLGKDYVRSVPRKEISRGNGIVGKEEAEQFLCSMLGDECELSLAVVRDVLCQCGYNIDKALDVLLDLSASSCGQSTNGRSYKDSLSYKEDIGFGFKQSDNLANGALDSMSFSSESELHENFWAPNRNYSKILTGSDTPYPSSTRSTDSHLPQKVLESLFKISRSPEHEPSKMNWGKVVKKMQSLGCGFDVSPPTCAEPHPDTYVKGEEYHAYRKGANQHWDATRSYYQKAAEAYTKGERVYASYLSEQGRAETKLARKADARASVDIFKARNKEIENVITIDLHGQHVSQAMRLLKMHLLFGSFVQSVRILRVITGCGSHGVGRSKVKQSVQKLLANEGMEWCEENRGTVLIKLDGCKDFKFVDNDSDAE